MSSAPLPYNNVGNFSRAECSQSCAAPLCFLGAPSVLPRCSLNAPSLRPLARSVLPLKRPCSLSRSGTVIPNPKFGVYIIYIYIHISLPLLRTSKIPTRCLRIYPIRRLGGSPYACLAVLHHYFIDLNFCVSYECPFHAALNGTPGPSQRQSVSTSRTCQTVALAHLY